MVWAQCKNCGKMSMRHSRDLCVTCYKKLLWKPQKKICKRCKREMILHAKGLCPGCYNFVFHLETNKRQNIEKYHNLDLLIYEEKTKKCVLCGFNKIVELHHLDENRKNNSEENLVGLCPNHHKMFHTYQFKQEIIEALEEKGFKIPQKIKSSFKLN